MAFITCAFWTAGGETHEVAFRRDLTMSFGALVLPLYTFRLYWRIISFHPAPLGGANPAQVLVGRGVALGMILAGVVLPVLYWAKEAQVGAGLSAFGISMPSFTTEPGIVVASLFWLGTVAFLLGFFLHIFGAFNHQYVLKDESLKRLAGRKIEL